MIRAIAASLLALGFAGSALADRGHDRDDHRRHDRRHDDRYDRRDNDRGRYDRGRDFRHYDRRDHRHYAPAPRYDYRWRAPRPRGWYPGWRESYGRGYRYWNDNYYYVVPASPSVELNFVLPLR